VPAELSNLSDAEIMERTLQPINAVKFYQNTLPSLLFANAGTSPLLKSISHYDPLNSSEKQDEIVIKLGTSIDAREYFREYGILSENDSLYDILSLLDTEMRIHLFLRLHILLGKNDQLKLIDIDFTTYLKNLYNYNIGRIRELRDLYDQTELAIYQWNGSTAAGSDFINIAVGRKQSKYNISQKINLEYSPDILISSSVTTLEKFSTSLFVTYKVKSEVKKFGLEIDFKLYELIIKINKGYRPNRVDKSVQVKFAQFVEKLVKYNSQLKELVIQQHNGESRKEFRLSYVAGFGDFEFKEIQ
jgi:DNA phosphorothioation-dependent restriction protein DptF